MTTNDKSNETLAQKIARELERKECIRDSDEPNAIAVIAHHLEPLERELIEARDGQQKARAELAVIAARLYITAFTEDEEVKWELPMQPEPLYFDEICAAVLEYINIADRQESKQEAENRELRKLLITRTEALFGMLNQFATVRIRGKVDALDVLDDGALSATADAFDALGLPDEMKRTELWDAEEQALKLLGKK